MSTASFQELIDSIEQLSPEEQNYLFELIQKREYGERGIRTLVTLTSKQHFQCCAFNRSAISPDGSRSTIIQ